MMTWKQYISIDESCLEYLTLEKESRTLNESETKEGRSESGIPLHTTMEDSID